MAPRRLLRRRHWLLVAFALVGTAGTASAQVKVAVLPINGPIAGAKQAQADIVKALRKSYTIVAQDEWDASAKKLFATSHSADDIAAVANDLQVQVVITGAIKKDGQWTLIVTVRNGPSGKAVEKLRYPLKAPRPDASVTKKLPDDLPPLIDKAAAGPPGGEETEPKEQAPPAETNPPPAEVDEKPPLAENKPPPEQPSGPRPDWAPYIDANVGAIFAGRQLSFDQAGLPQFRSSLTAGIRVDVAAYPLAFLAAKGTGGGNAVQGLGIGATLDYMFWPDSVPNPCSHPNPDGSCADHFATSEYRLEMGLRWHWNIAAKALKPELLVTADYGIHAFSIQKKPDGTDVGPPDVEYDYVSIGLGGRLPVLAQLAIVARFNFHIVLDSGAIQSASEYGPGGAWGLRLQVGAEARVWKGLKLGLFGFFERFGLSFDGATMKAPGTGAQGASDLFYGFWLTVGYVF